MDDIELDVDVTFQELFAYADRAAHFDEVGDEDEDQRVIEGDMLDLEPVVVDAVVLSLPFQPVCRPDCPGLDPESGELRDAEADAAPAVSIDPRWAALAEFKAEEERD